MAVWRCFYRLFGFPLPPAFSPARDRWEAALRYRDSLILLAAAFSTGAAAQSDPQAPEALPPEFRGEITYVGTYSGEITTKAERVRGPSVGAVVRSLTSSRTLPLRGDYTITVRFEGNTVRGSAQSRDRAGPDGAILEPDTFIGTRTGADCLLQWSEGPPLPARCSRAEFAFNLDEFTDHRGDEITLAVAASQTEFVDFRQRQLDGVAERVLQIASLADRIEAVRQAYRADNALPAYRCYRMGDELGLYDRQLADLQWLAADLEDIAADVTSSGNEDAQAALAPLSSEKIDELAAAARNDRAAAEANYARTCP